MKNENSNNNETKAMPYDNVLSDVFSQNDMIVFGNFIRDNYYVDGSPHMQPYENKYPKGTIDEIFIVWCCENGR